MTERKTLPPITCADCGEVDAPWEGETEYNFDPKTCKKCGKSICMYCQKTHGCLGFTLFGLTQSDLYSAGKAMGVI